MRVRSWICAVFFATSMSAAERMTVSVCTRGRLDQKAVAAAEDHAAALYRSIDIQIAWARCEIGLEGDAALQQHWFTVRLHDGKPFITPNPTALDTLGEAFLSFDDKGYLAEVYYQSVSAFATNRQIKFPALLGYVLAHELGHLLLGPGHAPQGVMRQSWDLRDLVAIRQNNLKFGPAEAARMRCVLGSTVDCSATVP
ncbi:MAG: hypothetical protein ACLP59_17790 [Bryobacteraceae bacterium]